MTCVHNNLLNLDEICKQFKIDEHLIFKDYFGFDFDYTMDIDRSFNSILPQLDAHDSSITKEIFFINLKKIKSELFRIIKIISHYDKNVLINQPNSLFKKEINFI